MTVFDITSAILSERKLTQRHFGPVLTESESEDVYSRHGFSLLPASASSCGSILIRLKVLEWHCYMHLGLTTSCGVGTYMEAWTAVAVRWHAHFTVTDWTVLHLYSNSIVLPPLLSHPGASPSLHFHALSEPCQRESSHHQSRLWEPSLVTQSCPFPNTSFPKMRFISTMPTRCGLHLSILDLCG